MDASARIRFSPTQTGLEKKKRGNRQARELRSRKQKIVARSSAEAELYAAALGASEAKGVESVVRDLDFAEQNTFSIDMDTSTWRICGWKMKSNRKG